MDRLRRHLREAAWLAAIALVWGALAPTVYAAARQSDPITFGEICGSAARVAAALAGDDAPAPMGASTGGCAFCLLGAGPAAPPLGEVARLAPFDARFALPAGDHAFLLPAAEPTTARSRAPPARLV